MAMVFNGVPAGHPDEDALDIALALLNNNSQTGTMDKLVLDGELTSAGASSPSSTSLSIVPV